MRQFGQIALRRRVGIDDCDRRADLDVRWRSEPEGQYGGRNADGRSKVVFHDLTSWRMGRSTPIPCLDSRGWRCA